MSPSDRLPQLCSCWRERKRPRPRAFFNLDWITLTVIAVIAAIGAIYFVIARPDRGVAKHTHDDMELTGAERGS